MRTNLVPAIALGLLALGASPGVAVAFDVMYPMKVSASGYAWTGEPNFPPSAKIKLTTRDVVAALAGLKKAPGHYKLVAVADCSDQNTALVGGALHVWDTRERKIVATGGYWEPPGGVAASQKVVLTEVGDELAQKLYGVGFVVVPWYGSREVQIPIMGTTTLAPLPKKLREPGMQACVQSVKSVSGLGRLLSTGAPGTITGYFGKVKVIIGKPIGRLD